MVHWKIIYTATKNIRYSRNKYSINYLPQTYLLHDFIKNISKDLFNNIFLDNDALLDNSNFPRNISLNTPAQILDKSNDGVCNSFKKNGSHLKKTENYKKEKYNEVTLNHLKNQIIKELTLEMSNKSIETTNPNALS